jgi:hypothetical protein
MHSPIAVARTSLCALLLPHTAGDQVDLHDPLHEAATAYFEKDPCGFCEDFILPTLQEVESLARKLGCGGVVTPTGCVASETDTLLCILLRLRSEMSWKSMAKHPVYRTPGSRWSVSKMKDIFRYGMMQMVQVHSGTIGWNSFCFSPARAAVYTQAIANKLGAPFNLIHNDIGYIVDGCLRSRTRSKTGPQGQNIQNLYYNGWQHGHKDGYQSFQGADGIHTSVLGGFFGCINDQTKWNRSNVAAACDLFCYHLFAQFPPHFAALQGDRCRASFALVACSQHVTKP